jgi:hypothetical protein
VAPLWLFRYWWYYSLKWGHSPPPEHSTTDFDDLPEACLVRVPVVYRVVSDLDLPERKVGYSARGYPPGDRMTDKEIEAHFNNFYPLIS